jgi:phage baseplate assembly protein W
MTQVDFPYRVDGRGGIASTSEDDHIRDLIEQVLFTAPGERVNRPTFGSGLLQLVFAPNGDALASATQLTVQGNLQQWLGELIQVLDVQVDNQESELRVVVRYSVRRSQQARVAEFRRSI